MEYAVQAHQSFKKFSARWDERAMFENWIFRRFFNSNRVITGSFFVRMPFFECLVNWKFSNILRTIVRFANIFQLYTFFDTFWIK